MSFPYPEVLSELESQHIQVASASRLSGGDINDVFKLSTNRGDLCIKINSESDFPGMLEGEMKGLEALTGKGIEVAAPIRFGQSEGTGFLLLHYIESGSKRPNFFEEFGTNLATLHQTTTDNFGFEGNNYIGSLNQINDWKSSWAEFYAENRILFQVKLAYDAGKMSQSDLVQAERFCNQIENLFPKETPSLIHGDLWSGNFMVNAEGAPILIDPAVYFGHREMDIGMSTLFGGFDHDFYRTYNAVFPLEQGWEDRIAFSQLYPLLVHVNLFGGGYLSSVRQIIKMF